jgi:hypothetical protein
MATILADKRSVYSGEAEWFVFFYLGSDLCRLCFSSFFDEQIRNVMPSHGLLAQ